MPRVSPLNRRAPSPGAERRRRRRERSLRSALVGLVAVVLLPLVAASAAFLFHEWRQQRDAAVARLQDESRALRQAIDRELALDRAVLNALATSRDIDAADWASFDDAARQATRVRPGSWFVLYDESGQALVHTGVPLGSPLPDFRALLAERAEVEWNGRTLPVPGAWLFAPFETHEPSFSGIFFGPVNRRPVVANTIPVLRGGRPRYVLALAYGSEFLTGILQREGAPDAVNSAIFDGAGRFVARNRDAQRYVGLPGPEPFRRGVAHLERRASARR